MWLFPLSGLLEREHQPLFNRLALSARLVVIAGRLKQIVRSPNLPLLHQEAGREWSYAFGDRQISQSLCRDPSNARVWSSGLRTGVMVSRERLTAGVCLGLCGLLGGVRSALEVRSA